MKKRLPSTRPPTRRAVLTAGMAVPLAIASGRARAATSAAPPAGASAAEARTGAVAPRPDHVLSIATQRVAPLGVPVEAMLVNGQNPGPEIRYTEGDTLRVLLENRSAVPTSVHWHGLIVPNWMDGVPGVTQMPIGPRQSFFVEYPIVQAGSYWYHSHFRLQEQIGLRGPLIIEEKRPPYAYDHDVICFASDWLNQSPDGIVPQMRGEAPRTAAVEAPQGDLYDLPGAKGPFAIDVTYPGFLLNGGTNDAPWTFSCKPGDRLRLRLINGATSATFRVALDGHPMTIVACDGIPCEPVATDSVVLAVAERYDVLVTIEKAGSFTLHWACVGQSNQVVGVIHTPGSTTAPSLERPKFGPRTAGMNDYSTLRSPHDTTPPDGPIKTFDIALGGVMKAYLWSMGGQYYPEVYVPPKLADADPLNIEWGDRVRIRLTNDTRMFHPMHLHGHFFRLLAEPGAWGERDAVIKDTVGVAPGGRVDIEFFADNPGHWFFHCHNLYHLAAGMARVFHYGVEPGGMFARPPRG